MVLRLFDSLIRQKVEFKPIQSKKVLFYSCGPTVYNHIHIGNAKTFLAYDFIKRCLIFLNYSVIHVQNITDVGHLTNDSDDGDDKILNQAKKEQIDPYKIARRYEDSYKADMKDLGWLEPTYQPRATEYIDQIIDFIKVLIEKNHAYESNGSIYFKVNSFEEYGKLSGNKLSELKEDASERTIKLDEKKDPRDFALWKAAEENHIMKWNSPWGMGFPGWHIECSVMAKELLGKTIDIKAGGVDLKFPHHEDEIAQSECCNETKYANFYMHSEHILINGSKMSKSKNNYFTARELIEKYGAGAVRLALISNNYRQQINFSDEFILQSKKSLEKYLDTYNKLKKFNEFSELDDGVKLSIQDNIDIINNNITVAINDDFNSPVVISEVLSFLKLINIHIDSNKINKEIKNILLKYFDSIDLIMNLLMYNNFDDDIPDEVQHLIRERELARQSKDWARSDELRDHLKTLGYNIKDSKEGTIISKL